MKLLAVETATEACSAAIWIDGRVLERFELAPRRHTELVLPMVDRLMAEAGLSMNDLDALAFGRGPGSFTGVRIATGVVQGLAFAADSPVIGISTLASLAQTCADRHERILAALDARMNEVYWGCYIRDEQGCMQVCGEEVVCPPASIPQPQPGGWLAAGSGWASHGDILCRQLPQQELTLVPDAWPRAAATATLAARHRDAGARVSADQARPVYLRDRVIRERQKTQELT